MSTPKVAKLSANSSTGHGVESLRLDISINTSPVVSVSVGSPTDDKVLRPLASGVLKEIQKLQAKRLTGGVSEPDITIQADDAVYGQISMDGYIAAPVLEISKANVGYTFSVIDKVGLLDCLDLSIYQSVVKMLRANEAKDRLPVQKDGNVCMLLKQLTALLVGSYQLALSKETDPVMKEVLKMQHEINQEPLKIWYKILTDSNVIHKSWSKAVGYHDSIGVQISNRALELLCQKNSGFWNTINGLLAAFQMYYQPDLTTYGKFCNNSSKTEKPTGPPLLLDTVNLNVADGSSRILQVGGVVMMATESAGLRAAETIGVNPVPGVAGVAPKELLPGYIHKDVPPIWLTDANGAMVLGSTIDKNKDKTQPSPANLSLKQYRERRAAAVQHLRDASQAKSDVLDELCQITFDDLQLADSRISARLPLNLTIKVGQRQVIHIGDDGTVEGFIAAVSHSIDLRAGAELDSFSQVTITHVKY